MSTLVDIVLDSDENKSAQIDIKTVKNLDELMSMFKQKIHMPDLNENDYAFQTKLQQILLSDIGDIDKAKKNVTVESHMEDKDYYDNNLKTDALVCRNIKAEAKTAVDEVKSIHKELKKISEEDSKG